MLYQDIIPKERIVPDKLTLQSNYPNPFNPSTTICFGLPEGQHVKLSIYSILGEKVATVVDDFREKGFHQITWNAFSQTGNTLSTGIYIYELRVGNQRLLKKMLFAK